MTVTIDPFATVLYLLLLSFGALLTLAGFGASIEGINEDGFVTHLGKLIAVGDITGAVDLCEETPRDPLAKGCRQLLVKSKRRDIDLTQAYAEEVALIAVWRASHRGQLVWVLNLTSLALTNLALWQLNPTPLMAVALVVCGLLPGGYVRSQGRRLVVKSFAYEAALLKVYGLLKARVQR